MKRLAYCPALLACLLLLAACDATIHQYPAPAEETQYTDFTVELNADRTPPPFYKEIVYDRKGNRTETDLEAEASPSYMPDERLALRFVVEVRDNQHTDDDGTPKVVERRELTVDGDALPPQGKMHFSLPAGGDYTAVSWCDYVPAVRPQDWHFDTTTLNFIRVNLQNNVQELHHKNSGTGYTRFRNRTDGAVEITHAYAATRESSSEIPTVTTTDSRVPVYMTRPAGRLRLYTDDLEEFRQAGGDIESVQVVIRYSQFVSVAYDALGQEPCQWISTRETHTTPSIVNETGNVCLAYDYILVDSDRETHVLADFYFYDAAGNELSHTVGVDVPLWRNRETVIRSRFLTQDIGQGGIGIDEDFDNEHVIVIN